MAKMKTVSVNAYAKVNFTLDILGREGGYHLLDSLVSTVSLFDSVTATARTDGKTTVSFTGVGAEGIPPRNNALRAAEAFSDVFSDAFSMAGADIAIDRKIPVGAGLGSSSADAAGVLRALAALHGISDTVRLKAIADSLGSDTGYLLTGGWARMTGRGEQIAPIADMPALSLLLLIPSAGVSTPQCFAAFDRRAETFSPRTNRAIGCLRAEGAKGAHAFGNALTRASEELNPEVAALLSEAAKLSGYGFGMTGSGSACYAVFASQEECLSARKRYQGTATALCVSTGTVQ